MKLISTTFFSYFRDPERTNQTIDALGWHHTGDIGQWLSNGTLKIIDRKKHIFKLSQGEYIVPEKIENIYVNSKYVEQVFVHGESLKVILNHEKNSDINLISIKFFQSCIVAIVVPNVETVKSWASSNNIPGTLTVLCNNAEIKNLILSDMTTLGKDAGLKSFEQVRII